MSVADRYRRSRRAAWLAIAFALPCAPAWAQDAPPPEVTTDAPSQAAAQALFDEARALFAADRYAEACPKLAESFRLDPGAGTQINLGHCYEKSGQLASAWTTFKDAAANARRAGRADWAQRAERRAELIAPHVPTLAVRVPAESNVAGLEVRRDGAVVGASAWGSAIPIDPGAHTVVATAPGYRKREIAVTATIDEHAEIDVPQLEQEPAPAPPEVVPHVETRPPDPPAPPPPSPSPRRTLGIATATAGAAGIATGIAFGIWAVSMSHEVERRCPSALPCHDQDAADLSRRSVTMGNVATVSLIAGGALAALGGVLYFSAPRRRADAAGASLGIGPRGIVFRSSF